MKINLGAVPAECRCGVQVGDVYPAKGGRGDTRYWLVIALTNSERSAHMLGLDIAGEVVSTASYGVHALEDRERIGFCEDVRSFCPDIEWSKRP